MWKIKLSLDTMKAYREMKVEVHAIIKSALDDGDKLHVRTYSLLL